MAEVLRSPSTIRSCRYDPNGGHDQTLPATAVGVARSRLASQLSTDIDDSMADQRDADATGNTTVASQGLTRLGLEKRQRPKLSFLDSPTKTDAESLVSFLKFPSKLPKLPTFRRAPFRNLSNLMSTFKKGLTRHTAMGKLGCDDAPSADDLDGDLDGDDENRPTSPTRSTPRAHTIRKVQSMYHTEREKPVELESNSVLGKSSLAHFKVDNDLLPRIDEDAMKDLLMGKHLHEFDEIVVIDSRFPYEFEGGHIKGAINISSQQDLEDKLIRAPLPPVAQRRTKLVVFHCEFSIFRGPTMASHLRKCDRIMNAAHYPQLEYPDIVVLEGGYKRFFDKYKDVHCAPKAYVEMRDTKYRKMCELEMNKVRQATKLTRAKSYSNLLLKASKPLMRPGAIHQHVRLSSYTTVTSHSENLKILKRQRSMSKMNSQSSLSDVFDSVDPDEDLLVSPTRALPAASHRAAFLDDVAFHPPPAPFRPTTSTGGALGRRPLPNLSLSSSITLYLSISDQGSAFSSTDSLDSYSSPLTEFPECFSSEKANKSATLHSYLKHSALSSILNPLTCKPSSALPHIPTTRGAGPSSQPLCTHQFNFPVQTLKSKGARYGGSTCTPNSRTLAASGGNVFFSSNSSSAVSMTTSIFNGTSSPVVSSPLSTITPASDSARGSSISSIIDPINETPVDFSVATKPHYKHARKRSGLLFASGSYNYVTLDIDDIDEEDDNDGDGTLTDIILANNPFDAKPFGSKGSFDT
jgi:M-phase inducer tyrosine phosphatase